MKIFILILFMLLSLHAKNLEQNKRLKVLHFAMEENSSINIADQIALMQQEIRHEIAEGFELILKAKGFSGTLLVIAQTNLLPYYRQNIMGLVLEETPANLFKMCVGERLQSKSSVCERVSSFQKELEGLASPMEMFIALSPVLQMDWYAPKTVLVGGKYQEDWIEALNENSVEYQVIDKLKEEDILSYFSVKKSDKIQPKSQEREPKYYGALLRFHLNKILYQPKNKIVTQKNLRYGLDKLQRYDVFFKEKSKQNPLMIYIHGGGWIGGDKGDYEALCQQYADKGFTSVSLNYRLLEHPRVGMEEMVEDVKIAIEEVLKKSKDYKANRSKVLVMAESAGGQLATVAISRLASTDKISVAIFNSMPTDLRLFSKEKQVGLSNIQNDNEREQWLDDYSAINQLDHYDVPTLVVHGFKDRLVSAKHLEDFEILSVLYKNNIKSLWVEGAMHPLSPQEKSLQPGYGDIEKESMLFIDKFIK